MSAPSIANPTTNDSTQQTVNTGSLNNRIGRIGSARPELCEIEDVAECVAFLATDAGRGYHGSCINIDAGVTAG